MRRLLSAALLTAATWGDTTPAPISWSQLRAQSEDGPRTPEPTPAPTPEEVICSPALLAAAEYGDLEQMNISLQTEPVNCQDDRGKTPLHYAASNRRIPIAVELLAQGATMERDNLGQTALHSAASVGDTNMTNLLLDYGAYIQLADNAGRTPLILAAWFGQLEIISLLLERGAKIDATDGDGGTALHHSAKSDAYIATSRLLVDSGADVHAADVIGFTPLHYSAFENQPNSTKYFVSVGANMFHTDASGWSPLFHAARNGHEEITEWLIVYHLEPEVFATPDPTGFNEQDINTTLIGPITEWMAALLFITMTFTCIVIPFFCVVRREANLSKEYDTEDTPEDFEAFIEDIFENALSASKLKALGSQWDKIPAHTLGDLHRVRNAT